MFHGEHLIKCCCSYFQRENITYYILENPNASAPRRQNYKESTSVEVHTPI
eukprot:c21166_g4_i1 orf=393-545(+)